ncbi:MAG TPA: aldehyde dehydrogenase family protein, partial [Solirubrobacteraceae bacterium]
MSTQQETKIESSHLFIGGRWAAPLGSGRIAVHSASTEELIGSVPEAAQEDVDAAVGAARAAFDDPSGWSSWTADQRADALERLADALERRGEDTAQRVSAQNGMPIAISRQIEAVFPAAMCRYYAGLARETAFVEQRTGLLGGDIEVLRKPVGVVGAIVP